MGLLSFSIEAGKAIDGHISQNRTNEIGERRREGNRKCFTCTLRIENQKQFNTYKKL